MNGEEEIKKEGGEVSKIENLSTSIDQGKVQKPIPGPTVDKSFDSIEILTKQVEKTLIEVKETKNLVYIGFIIVLIMVAAIIISLFLQFISSYNSNSEKIYNFELENIKNYNSYQNQIKKFDDSNSDLKNQIGGLKDCLKSGKYYQCF